VPAETLADAVSRPTVRAEPVLDGTGGIAQTCRLYRTLRIPIAVIADLDMLVDRDKMNRVLQELVGDVAVRSPLLEESTELAEKIRNLPPTVPVDEVAAELVNLSTSTMDWTKNDDLKIKRRLARLVHKLDRMRRLERKGVSGFPAEIATGLSELLTRLQKVGLFLVPLGDVEEWLASENLAISKSNKWAWSNAAAERILQRGRQSGDIWDFMNAVGHYLTSPALGGVLPNPSLQPAGPASSPCAV
jgi:hypothetical protein